MLLIHSVNVSRLHSLCLVLEYTIVTNLVSPFSELLVQGRRHGVRDIAQQEECCGAGMYKMQGHGKESPNSAWGESGKASHGKGLLSFVWKDKTVGTACAKA